MLAVDNLFDTVLPGNCIMGNIIDVLYVYVETSLFPLLSVPVSSRFRLLFSFYSFTEAKGTIHFPYNLLTRICVTPHDSAVKNMQQNIKLG